ncbi:MAG: hypothetical protein ACREJO_02480 [Phycisphaerales bacterium]
MRFPWNKVYRAFPELDRFSNAECENYVRIARERYGGSMAWALAVGIVLVIVTLIVASIVMDPLIEAIHPRTRSILELPIGAVQLLIYLGAPAFGWLIARDIWLRRAIRQQLFDTLCPGCKYQLLGLPIDHESVQCPECGRRTALNDFAAAREIFLSAAASVDTSPIPPVIRSS